MRRALALAPALALALALALAIASPAALPLAATAATPVATVSASAAHPELSSERVTLTTDHGDITLAFYPRLAPKTCEHIYELFALGLYDTNHIFRVDRGFVAQVRRRALERVALRVSALCACVRVRVRARVCVCTRVRLRT